MFLINILNTAKELLGRDFSTLEDEKKRRRWKYCEDEDDVKDEEEEEEEEEVEEDIDNSEIDSRIDLENKDDSGGSGVDLEVNVVQKPIRYYCPHEYCKHNEKPSNCCSKKTDPFKKKWHLKNHLKTNHSYCFKHSTTCKIDHPPSKDFKEGKSQFCSHSRCYQFFENEKRLIYHEKQQHPLCAKGWSCDLVACSAYKGKNHNSTYKISEYYNKRIANKDMNNNKNNKKNKRRKTNK